MANSSVFMADVFTIIGRTLMNIGLPWNEDFPLLGFLTNIVAAKTTLKVNAVSYTHLTLPTGDLV